ncbi:MAG TPA: GNAT family N-acetyltransferase [Actinomycetota bacterium]|nr:GNAT family N-acetyltransferase [Actinomycetota bacterium]
MEAEEDVARPETSVREADVGGAMKSGIRVVQAQNADDLAAVRELFWEYLQWANANVNAEFSVNFDIASMLERDMQSIEKFSLPTGRLMLGEIDDRVVGVGCLQRLRPGIGEIKRMYVRPEARKAGVGRALLASLMSEAKLAGYSSVRLDSAGFMRAAHVMYRSAGFHEIEPYPESEIPKEFQRHWVFMERDL